MAVASPKEKEIIHALLLLTLNPKGVDEAFATFERLSEAERETFVSLADSNHVVLRALEPLRRKALEMGQESIAQWAGNHIEREKARVTNALEYLHRICNELENNGCAVSVMKSLEHVPDLGSDLDLYTTAPEEAIIAVLTRAFHAHVEERSWGDRLAHKWNFSIPGLPEAVEVHAQRLGQTGEHTLMARRFVSRRVSKTVGGHTFLVPAPEEALIVATLQRMYRHFYFRICDMVNSAAVLESGTVNFVELKKAADLGGIWPGVCSYMKIVSDYVEKYRGAGIDLPQQVLHDASFGGEKTFVRARFIRVPIMPQGAELYTKQVTTTAMRGDVPATLRLTLLPYLASAAAISFKLTGSDKGIW